MTHGPSLTLRGSVYGFALACLLGAAVISGGFLHLKGALFTDTTLDYAVRFRTSAAAQDLARTLERDWRDLGFLSEQVGVVGSSDLSLMMTGAAGDGSRISWAGYADLSGQVIAATNSFLVGHDVSERPWFQNGLRGGFAGDVHDALLLAKLLGSDDNPVRFIDLARRVIDAEGNPAGVVGMHIDAAWLETYLRETADLFGIDLYLIGPDGEVTASSDGDQPTPAELQILRAAQTGIQTQGRETWPDGQDYFSSLVPQVAYGDLPNFGWRMIGRLDAESLSFGIELVRYGAHYAVAGALALIAILTLLYANVVVAPIARLAASAHRISTGSKEYPADSRVTLEAAQLSAALATLQHRISDEH